MKKSRSSIYYMGNEFVRNGLKREYEDIELDEYTIQRLIDKNDPNISFIPKTKHETNNHINYNSIKYDNNNLCG